MQSNFPSPSSELIIMMRISFVPAQPIATYMGMQFSNRPQNSLYSYAKVKIS